MVEDLDTIEATLKSTQGNGQIFIDFRTFVEVSDEVTVTIREKDTGSIVAEDTLSVGNLEWGVVVTKDGEFIDIYGASETETYTEDELQDTTVTVDTGSREIVIEEFPYEKSFESDPEEE